MHGSCRRLRRRPFGLRAVAALVAGRTREDVAAVFQVSLKAVDNWWAKWLTGGREALVA
ncbi:helix-turn-helix domain-containing protein [Streptomyces bottropensis]|uniref:helix-turn-helix domain-containing protein n=1 Tax=Streptomyces bottropensis TaxID=42235 RepID=UPI00380EDA13